MTMGLSASERIEKKMLLDHLYNKALEKSRLDIWRLNPDVWLKERFGEDVNAILWDQYPEYAAHVWDGTPNPLYQAWKEVANGNWTGVESATGTGKTYILSRIVFWYLDCFENSLVVTSAPKKDQLSLHLWSEISRSFHKFKLIRPNAELTNLKLRVDVTKKEYSESWIAQGFIAGVKANEESTTKAQGFHRDRMLIITEETPGMPWPTLNAFINTSGGDNNVILCMGNPDSVTDPLHQFITTFPNVKMVRVSAMDHPNIVLGKSIIPGAVSLKSIQIRRDKFGAENSFYKSRVHGIAPEQGSDSLIKYRWIQSCIPGTKEWTSDIPDIESWNALGMDVANSEAGDKAALAWGQSNKLVELQNFFCPNANDLAYNVLYFDDELFTMGKESYGAYKIETYNIDPQLIGVDSVGVGAGTVNAFKHEGHTVYPIQGGQIEEIIPKDAEEKPLFNFSSLRAQIYWILAQDLQHRRIIFDIDKVVLAKLTKQLIIPKFKVSGGKLSVESKEEIKKRMGGESPDLADAVAYWNFMRYGYHVGSGVFMPMR